MSAGTFPPKLEVTDIFRRHRNMGHRQPRATRRVMTVERLITAEGKKIWFCAGERPTSAAGLGSRGGLLVAANYLAIMPAPMVWSIAFGGEPGGQVEESAARAAIGLRRRPGSSRNRPETKLRISCSPLRAHSPSGW